MLFSRTSLVALAALVAGVTLAPQVHANASRPDTSDARAGDSWLTRVESALHRIPVLSVVPVDAPPSSEYGRRRDPIRKRRRRMHRGIDFAAKRGQPVLSAGAGRVVLARRKGAYGRIVIVDHGFGVRTRYAHLRRVHVSAGDLVAAGDEIGEVGSTGRTTGPHLHFEVRLSGRSVDPREVMEIPTRYEWATSHSLRDRSLQL